MKQRTRRALRALPPLLLAVCFVSLAIRATVRDAWRPLAPVFYATPLGLVTPAALTAAVVAGMQKRRKLALFAWAVTAVSATCLVVLETGGGAAPHDPEEPLLRGLLWNTQESRAAWEPKVRFAREREPDLLVLVEGPEREEGAAIWRDGLPGYACAALPGRRYVFVRGRGARIEPWPGTGEPGEDAAGARVSGVGAEGASFALLVVDIPGNPFRDRAPRLAKILDRAVSSGEERLLVLGDFNTPRESAHLDAWRGPLVQAFDAAGQGWGPTWPSYVPVLSLDQVWGARGIEFLRWWTAASRASDHLPVMFEFRVRD